MNETLFTADQAAAELNKTSRAVRIAANKHKIGVRLGRDWLFNEADLVELSALPGPGRPARPADGSDRNQEPTNPVGARIPSGGGDGHQPPFLAEQTGP